MVASGTTQSVSWYIMTVLFATRAGTAPAHFWSVERRIVRPVGSGRLHRILYNSSPAKAARDSILNRVRIELVPDLRPECVGYLRLLGGSVGPLVGVLAQIEELFIGVVNVDIFVVTPMGHETRCLHAFAVIFRKHDSVFDLTCHCFEQTPTIGRQSVTLRDASDVEKGREQID